MKTEELTALGLNDEQIKAVFALNGKDVESAKNGLQKQISDLTVTNEGLTTKLTNAEDALKKFEGIDPQQIQSEIEAYKKKVEDAEKHYTKQITERDQKDWIKAKLDEYGVASPYARRQLTADCMSSDSGLTWKDGAFFGFDDFMKSAKEKDASLYKTAEEKKAEDESKKDDDKKPKFTNDDGGNGGGNDKFIPPRVF